MDKNSVDTGLQSWLHQNTADNFECSVVIISRMYTIVFINCFHYKRTLLLPCGIVKICNKITINYQG